MIIHSHHINHNCQESDNLPFGAVPAVTYTSPNSPNFKKHWTFAVNTLILLLKHLNLISTAYAEL